jgi:hypothetical protein
MPTFGSKGDPVETCWRWLLKVLLPQYKCDRRRQLVSHYADMQGKVYRTLRKSTLVKKGFAEAVASR